MYQVMLADDEEIILEMLIHMVDWKALGYRIAGCFRDGADLLEALEYNHADLIITDIKMNQVSGLEVARYIHEKLPYCKVLLVSGYLEFQLAVEAIRYGVADYLAKPLELHKLNATLEKIRAQLDEQRRDRRIQREMMQRLETTHLLMKEKTFSEIAFGDAHNAHQLLRQLKTLYPDYPFQNAQCCLCECSVVDYPCYLEESWMNDTEQFENGLQSYFQQPVEQMLVHKLYVTKGVIGLLALIPEKAPQEWLQMLKKELELHFSMRLHLAVKQCYRLELDQKQPIQHLSSTDDQLLLHEYKQQILSNICDGNVNTAQRILQSICRELESSSVLWVRQFMANLLVDMVVVLDKTNPALALKLRRLMQEQQLFTLVNAQQIQAYMLRIFDQLKAAGIPKLNSHPESFVEQAKKYVLDHITEDISREDVAESLFICATYLSRLFREQTGETFSQYLVRMKISKAIELLQNPKYKIYEICNFLGYKTPRYFSSVFRAHTGMNPSEYRRSVLHLEVADDE